MIDVYFAVSFLYLYDYFKEKQNNIKQTNRKIFSPTDN